MVLAVMGAMLPPIPPSTQQSCDCLSRREVSTFIPVATAALRLTLCAARLFPTGIR